MSERLMLTKDDCISWLGGYQSQEYVDYCTRRLRGQRRGQAWYNTLWSADQMKLVGSMNDPFHADDWAAVIRALEFLLEN